nr:phosphoglycolate phosphatase [Litorivivens lipolytica]
MLFDLDGTLIDSVPDLASAVDHTLKHADLPPAGETLVRGWVGNGARKLLERALKHAQSDADLDALLPVFFEAYEACCAEYTVAYPGVEAALQHWHKQGIRLACVTNKPERFALKIVRHFGWDKVMPVVLGGDSLPQRKPSPEPLWEACERLGVERTDALMVGDSVNDVEAARAAGMPVIAVPYGYNYGSDIREAKPDLVVEQLDELI